MNLPPQPPAVRRSFQLVIDGEVRDDVHLDEESDLDREIAAFKLAASGYGWQPQLIELRTTTTTIESRIVERKGSKI